MAGIWDKASELPEAWDSFSEINPFMKIECLERLERLNPCGQRYHFDEEAGFAAVSYQMKLDLLTFAKGVSLKMPATIVGIPMSVSRCGYVLKNRLKTRAFSRYIGSQSGLWIVLNSEDDLELPGGKTLPSCRMELPWESLDGYLESMRSHYRYRLKKAQSRFEGIKAFPAQSNGEFSESFYALYESVYENSKEKLEKLPPVFFSEFPSRIIPFEKDGIPAGFLQIYENGRELVFLFGGFRRDWNKPHDLYMNMLLELVSYGIAGGFECLELGQTAEETKLKLGARLVEKRFYLHHDNTIVKSLLSALAGRFSYKGYQTIHEVFKGGSNENTPGQMP